MRTDTFDEVLKRMDVSKMMGKELGELANMQMFGYGSMMDDYYIAIMTTNFKKDVNWRMILYIFYNCYV